MELGRFLPVPGNVSRVVLLHYSNSKEFHVKNNPKAKILMLLHALFISLALFWSLGDLTSAHAADRQSESQKLLEAEQLFSAETKDRIASVRSSDIVMCGFLDKEGILWFGSNNGVYRYDGVSFTNFTTKDGLSNNRVFSIVEDREGILWFGTENGLCRYDRTTFVHIPIPWSKISGPWLDKVYPVVNPNQVMCMLQDRNGDFWLGTNGAGAYQYDGEKFTSYLSKEGRQNADGSYHNIIHSMLEDEAGNIWFTSINHGGVSRFDGKTFTHFSMKDGLSDDMVRTSFQDNGGRIWFGTHGKYTKTGERDGGLDYYDGNSFTQLVQKNGLLRGHVRSIYEDKEGHLWVGRWIGSMSIYDGKEFTPFVTEDGQEFDGVAFIMDDAEGNVWFGGSKGKLLRYDGNSVIDFSAKGH